MNRKSDDQLLAEATALEKAYAEAEISDLRWQNEYLLRVLSNLVDQINEEIGTDSGTRHFWAAVEEAEEALGRAE